MTTTPKAKFAISMSPRLLAKVRASVARRQAKSVSAYIEHAVAAQLAAEANFDQLLEEMLEETGGPVTAKERAAAAKVLRGAA